MPSPPDLTQLLSGAQLPQETKAHLWDVFQAAKTPDDLAAQLQALPVPTELKAQLWDAKAASGASAPPQLNFATVNGQRVPMETWAQTLDVDKTSLAPAVDFAEGLAAVPGQLVFGGGDVIRRATNMPRIINASGVQRAMSVPDSDAGRAGNLLGQVAPLAYGFVTAPVVTTAGVLASLLAKPAQPVIAAGAERLGATPQQAEAMGTIGEFALGSAMGIKAGSLAGQHGSPRVAGWFRNPDANDAAAVDAALRGGLPVDVPTATGNRFARGVQWLADRTLPGSVIATTRDRKTVGAWRGQWNALANRTGVTQPTSLFAAGTEAQAGVQTSRDRLQRSVRLDADRLSRTPSGTMAQSPEDAGRSTKDRLLEVIRRLAGRATDDGYAPAWAQANARPVLVPVTETLPDGTVMERHESMAAPVDMLPLQTAGRRQLQIMNQWLQPALRNASAGYQALRSIVEGPRYVPAEVAEMGRSGLLELSREATLPAARDVSQATGARLASLLTEQIDQAMEQHAGPTALAALRLGRATHAEKMGVVETLTTLADEPVQAFGNLTWGGDRGIDRLRAIEKAAPGAMGEVGRAWFQGLIEKFTDATGGLDLTKAEVMQRMWQELGPETKRLFFAAAPQRQSVGAFFDQMSTARTALGPNLGAEPKLVAQNLIGLEDTHAAQLEAVARLAPGVPRQLARAALDDVAAKFDKNPSIENLSKFRTWWNGLGARTKGTLFPNPSLAHAIDQATRVMQLISENPNRSGTAFVGAIAAQGAALADAPLQFGFLQTVGGVLSAALRSTRAAKILTQGLMLPNTPQAATLAGVLIQTILAEQQGVPPMQQQQQEGK